MQSDAIRDRHQSRGMKKQALKQTYITVLTEKSYQELYFRKIKDTALTVFCLLFLNNIGW